MLESSRTAVRAGTGAQQANQPVAMPITLKGRRTRRELMNAARTLFIENGYGSTRVSDIANLAGTSYGTFYHYFVTKEAVAVELFNEVSGEILAAAYSLDRDDLDPISRIADANKRFLQAFYDSREMIAILEELALTNEAFRQIKLRIRRPFVARNAAGIAKLQKLGMADPDLDPELTASILGGMIENMTHLWFLHNEPYDEDEATRTLTRIWANALRLPSE